MSKKWKRNKYPFVVSPTDYELEKSFSKSEILDDIEYMQNTLEEVHPNLYFSKTEDSAKEELKKIKNSLPDKLSRMELYFHIAPYLSSFKDGHTSISVPHEEYVKSDEVGSVRFPFGVDCSRGKVILKFTVLEEFQEFVGRRLISINGVAIGEILEKMTSMISGESLSFKYNYLFMLFSKLLFVLGYSSEKYVLEVTGNTSIEEIAVPGITRAQSKIDSEKNKSGAAQKNNYKIYPEFDCAVVSLVSCDNQEISRKFFGNLFNTLEEEKIGKLIIDLRHNGGGNSSAGDELSAFLTDKPVRQFSGMEMKLSKKVKESYTAKHRDNLKFPLKLIPLKLLALSNSIFRMKAGSIYKVSIPETKPSSKESLYEGLVVVVTSTCTYSAAASLAAMVKAYGLGKIVGEATGGYVSTYGDSFSFSLPNTKLRCGVSHKFILGPDGSRTPEPTYPDYSSDELGIDNIFADDAISKIMMNLSMLIRN